MMLKEFPHIFAAVAVEMLEHGLESPIPLGEEVLPSWDIPLFTRAENYVASLPNKQRWPIIDALMKDGTPTSEQPWYNRECELFSELVSRVVGL